MTPKALVSPLMVIKWTNFLVHDQHKSPLANDWEQLEATSAASHHFGPWLPVVQKFYLLLGRDWHYCLFPCLIFWTGMHQVSDCVALNTTHLPMWFPFTRSAAFLGYASHLMSEAFSYKVVQSITWIACNVGKDTNRDVKTLSLFHLHCCYHYPVSSSVSFFKIASIWSMDSLPSLDDVQRSCLIWAVSPVTNPHLSV